MPAEMKIGDYFEWCYDHDVLVECWITGSRNGTSHGTCRNVRKLTYDQFIDVVNIMFKDSTFRNNYQPLGAPDQQRHRTLIFIYDLMRRYGVQSGNPADEDVPKKPHYMFDEDTEETKPQGCDEQGRLIVNRNRWRPIYSDGMIESSIHGGESPQECRVRLMRGAGYSNSQIERELVRIEEMRRRIGTGEISPARLEVSAFDTTVNMSNPYYTLDRDDGDDRDD